MCEDELKKVTNKGGGVRLDCLISKLPFSCPFSPSLVMHFFPIASLFPFLLEADYMYGRGNNVESSSQLGGSSCEIQVVLEN